MEFGGWGKGGGGAVAGEQVDVSMMAWSEEEEEEVFHMLRSMCPNIACTNVQHE